MTANLWHGLIDDPNLTSAEKLVGVVYVRHQDGTGWGYPSPERIARLSGISRSKVYEAITGLRSKNWLFEEHDESGRYRCRVEQRQGVLPFSRDKRHDDREFPEEKSPEVWKTTTANLHSGPPGGKPVHQVDEKSVQLLKTENLNPRAQPARGSVLWKLRAKAQRIQREIDTINEVYVGAFGDALLHRDYKLRLLYAELERTGWKDSRAG